MHNPSAEKEEKRRCVLDGLTYTSNPPQNRCKECRQFWFSKDPSPICKSIEIPFYSLFQAKKERCLGKCHSLNEPCEDCKFSPHLKTDWESNALLLFGRLFSIPTGEGKEFQEVCDYGISLIRSLCSSAYQEGIKIGHKHKNATECYPFVRDEAFQAGREEERERILKIIENIYHKTEVEFGTGQYPGSGNLIGAILSSLDTESTK